MLSVVNLPLRCEGSSSWWKDVQYEPGLGSANYVPNVADLLLEGTSYGRAAGCVVCSAHDPWTASLQSSHS